MPLLLHTTQTSFTWLRPGVHRDRQANNQKKSILRQQQKKKKTKRDIRMRDAGEKKIVLIAMN